MARMIKSFKKLTVKEAESIEERVNFDGLRKTILTLNEGNTDIYSVTAKIDAGFIRILETIKIVGYNKGIFSTPPKNTDIILVALEDMAKKVLVQEKLDQ
jgi:hypothetical protein